MSSVREGYTIAPGGYYRDADNSGPYAIDSDGVATLVSGGEGSGGGTSQVEVTNFPATQPVSGPLTNAQLTAVTGTAATAEWAGTGNATLIAIQKAIYAQNEQMIALLEEIRDNTGGT